jgi:hypothetical protein
MSKLSEVVWFLLSFCLFIILGPFAAPVALVTVLTCGKGERDRLQEPESHE